MNTLLQFRPCVIILIHYCELFNHSEVSGCRYKILVNMLYIPSYWCYNKIIDKEVVMGDIKSPSSVTIGELTRIVKEFEEKIQNGTEDPIFGASSSVTPTLYIQICSRHSSRTSMKRNWSAKKKGIPSQRDKTSHTQKGRAPDPHTSRGSPLPQNDADSRRFWLQRGAL